MGTRDCRFTVRLAARVRIPRCRWPWKFYQTVSVSTGLSRPSAHAPHSSIYPQFRLSLMRPLSHLRRPCKTNRETLQRIAVLADPAYSDCSHFRTYLCPIPSASGFSFTDRPSLQVKRACLSTYLSITPPSPIPLHCSHGRHHLICWICVTSYTTLSLSGPPYASLVARLFR